MDRDDELRSDDELDPAIMAADPIEDELDDVAIPGDESLDALADEELDEDEDDFDDIEADEEAI